MIPRLALVPGEPAGIGPELCVRLVQRPRTDCQLLAYGDAATLQAAADALGLPVLGSIASLVLLLIAIISRVNLFTYLGAALLIFCYYRTFSRNISKRTEENYKFYTLKDRVDNKFKGWKEQWANRKVYHYYRCPQCRQKLRVPRGRGRIQISCPRCGTQFIKKS